MAHIRTLPCAACGRKGTDAAHIRSKGAGGSDDLGNLLPLCREHHTAQHKMGWVKFCEDFPQALLYLRRLGWEFVDWKLRESQK